MNVHTHGASDDQWRTLDKGIMDQLWKSFWTDSIAPSCVRVVDTNLLSLGIMFNDTNLTKKTSLEFQNHVNAHFVKFVRESLVQLMVFGVSFYVVNVDVPVCLPYGAVTVQYRYNTKTYAIEFAAMMNGKMDPNVFTIVENGPDFTGNFTSNMAIYMRQRSLLDTFIRCAVYADVSNANPPIYTMQQTDRVFDDRDVGTVAEGDITRASLVRDDMRTRQRIAVGSHEFNEYLVEKLNSQSVDQTRRNKTDPNTGLDHFDANMQPPTQPVVPLPLDARVATVPRPVTRSDMMHVHQHFQQMACVAFGVNSEAVGIYHSREARSADALDRINSLTAHTVKRWADVFSWELKKVYALVWGDDPTVDTKEVCVLFPSTVSLPMANQLFRQNILTREAFVDIVSRVLNLPHSSFVLEAPPLLTTQPPPQQPEQTDTSFRPE